jgi:D-serine deaminase-like pyridoxal phosphate-dependent protein
MDRDSDPGDIAADGRRDSAISSRSPGSQTGDVEVSLLADTARLLDGLDLEAPAVVVDETRARANLAAMAARAAASGTRLRPHFKTHDNVGVGRWFREAGVRHAAVSSLAMAGRFALDGWDDLTLAILVNPRELPRLAELAWRLADRGGGLGLVVDSPEAARAVRHIVGDTAPLWLKVDTGYGRSGVLWDAAPRLLAVARSAAFAGLLTHAGHSYRTPREALPALFTETARRLASARESTGRDLQLSVGDTPTCTAVERFTGVDEVRPGNFIFHDLMQRAAGVCGDEQLAVALACPVIGVDARRGRLVLHGGAVHLGREPVDTKGGPVFGCLGTVSSQGFGKVLDSAPVTGLSQEHGIVSIAPADWEELAGGMKAGDHVLVFPAHSCLTCNLQGASMRTFTGAVLPRDAGTDSD